MESTRVGFPFVFDATLRVMVAIGLGIS